ncbi:NUDIX domain-containing protein [Ornithinibacillus sp. L9]|uniref:NUDIX domain-containing protein n=1 Tax=Ornithinibacillus caprae TaxID=2678566 RepID=A0A6N8FRG7_9BACI|nr:NUDIX domain-containing protein [Ornithinibacillus caprae]MUK90388.1 NUDIX domain-containing protein [Ornithinibacillus caprae]
MTTTYVNWGESKVKLTWHANQTLPSRNLITSVHGYCFHEEKLMLVNLNQRGWDIPGGHIEQDETPEECFKREAMEEGYIEGRCYPLGYIIVDHSENTKWDESSPYPEIGYQVFYRMDIEQLHPFEAKFESFQRVFIKTDEITNYYQGWHEFHQEILNCALTNKKRMV